MVIYVLHHLQCTMARSLVLLYHVGLYEYSWMYLCNFVNMIYQDRFTGSGVIIQLNFFYEITTKYTGRYQAVPSQASLLFSSLLFSSLLFSSLLFSSLLFPSPSPSPSPFFSSLLFSSLLFSSLLFSSLLSSLLLFSSLLTFSSHSLSHPPHPTYTLTMAIKLVTSSISLFLQTASGHTGVIGNMM